MKVHADFALAAPDGIACELYEIGRAGHLVVRQVRRLEAVTVRTALEARKNRALRVDACRGRDQRSSPSVSIVIRKDGLIAREARATSGGLSGRMRSASACGHSSRARAMHQSLVARAPKKMLGGVR
jgi:hypothetical protein